VPKGARAHRETPFDYRTVSSLKLIVDPERGNDAHAIGSEAQSAADTFGLASRFVDRAGQSCRWLRPLTPKKLAELTRLTTGGVTVVLDRLEKAGVIRRAPNPSDRRSSIVQVSQKFLRSTQAAYARRVQ
jgi:hypothetical protein